MKFSYSWLKDLVEFKQTPEKLAEFLSEHAFEAISEESHKEFEKIIVARVTKVEKHPNADRLRVIELIDGTNTIAPVVCGAWNFDLNAIVALALPGATIPHDQHDPEGKSFVLSKAKIRGIESQGMICSGKELGITQDGDGILVLDNSKILGSTFTVESRNSQPLLDISLPANRPDLLGHLGIAREIAALTKNKLKFKEPKAIVTKLKSKILKVQVASPKLCPKYSAVRLVNVRVKDSPKFIQARLEAAGMRPINNIVDITNYVMLELGQPLHAFDAAKLTGGIKVRHAFVNEKITTLDGIDRTLDSETLVIADSKKAIAIAGIIGGLESAVSNITSEIILEAANFNSVTVRKTYKRIGLRTDAASRFEKGLPIAFADQAIEYACALLKEHAQAKAVEFVSVKSPEGPIIQLDLNPKDVNALLGFMVKDLEQKKILSQFGFKVVPKGKIFKVTVPNYRPDVRLWQDLAEEIGRYIGLNNIPMTPVAIIPSTVPSNPVLIVADTIRDILVGLGFDEFYTYSFVPESVFKEYGIPKEKAVEIANPIASELKYMRLGIGMNYPQMVEQNSRYALEQGMFEIGNVYSWNKGTLDEHTNLFMLKFSKNQNPEQEFIGSLNELFARLNITLQINQQEPQKGLVYANGQEIGNITSGRNDVRWVAVEMNLEQLIKHSKPKTYINISKYPSRQLDLAVLVNEELPWEKVRALVLGLKIKLISDIELLEVYQGSKVGPGKKSFTFRLTYQSFERTLTDEEVAKFQDQIIRQLKQELNAEVRN